jgi:hypothetical protein
MLSLGCHLVSGINHNLEPDSRPPHRGRKENWTIENTKEPQSRLTGKAKATSSITNLLLVTKLLSRRKLKDQIMFCFLASLFTSYFVILF